MPPTTLPVFHSTMVFAHVRSVLLIPLVAVALLLCAFAPPSLIDSDHSPMLRVHPAAADPTPFTTAVGAVGAPVALVYDLDAARTLFARAADTPRAPASLTKLMTTLLLLEEGDLGRPVIVQGVDLIGDASMGLQAGEEVSLEELLWGMLLPSGNDAAMTVARALGGDPEAFVAKMNERAAALGLSATHFMSPHGLDRDEQTSSARDLLRIALLDWREPLFREVVGTAATTVAGHPLVNTNELLGPLADSPSVTVVGVKTGTTDLAGQCLIAAFERDGRVTFVIVMGSSDRFGDVQALDRAVAARTTWFTPKATDFAALNRAPGPDGTIRYLMGGGAPPVLLERWQFAYLQPVRLIANRNSSTWSHGMVIGRIEWRMGTQVLSTEQLVVR